MSNTARPTRGALFGSMVLHGAAFVALALGMDSGVPAKGLPERLFVALPFEVEAEPEPPAPLATPPEAREPEEEQALEENLPAEEDTRAVDALPSENLPDARDRFIGLGAGGPLPRVRRPGRGGSPAPAAAAAEDAPPPAPAPLPAGPTRAALPLAGECPAPAYPALERRRGVEGVVALRILVNAHGEVESVEVEGSSGSPLLDAAALTAVSGWRFRPALLEGVPVADVVLQSVRFRLDAAAIAREER